MTDPGPDTKTLISKAIDDYADRSGSGSGAPPYDSSSLAEIYAPCVQELLDLQGEGFVYAAWKWDPERKENRWHGELCRWYVLCTNPAVTTRDAPVLICAECDARIEKATEGTLKHG